MTKHFFVAWITAVTVAVGSVGATTQDATIDPAQCMAEARVVRPGMTRQDLLVMFTTEGGLSNRLRRTYVHRDCPRTKIDVRFAPASDPQEMLKEDPMDVIESVSEPYEANQVMD